MADLEFKSEGDGTVLCQMGTDIQTDANGRILCVCPGCAKEFTVRGMDDMWWPGGSHLSTYPQPKEKFTITVPKWD